MVDSISLQGVKSPTFSMLRDGFSQFSMHGNDGLSQPEIEKLRGKSNTAARTLWHIVREVSPDRKV